MLQIISLSSGEKHTRSLSVPNPSSPEGFFNKMRPQQIRKSWPYHTSREFVVELNWKNLPESAIHLFNKRVECTLFCLLSFMPFAQVGPIFFSQIHPLVFAVNKHLIIRYTLEYLICISGIHESQLRSGYPQRFGPGDEFANLSSLQVFQLHPEPKGDAGGGRGGGASGN